jgi:hypothetical protein
VLLRVLRGSGFWKLLQYPLTVPANKLQQTSFSKQASANKLQQTSFSKQASANKLQQSNFSNQTSAIKDRQIA